MSLQKDFALVQAFICTTALVDAEQEQPRSGFIDISVQVCFTHLSSPSFEVEWPENRPKAPL